MESPDKTTVDAAEPRIKKRIIRNKQKLTGIMITRSSCEFSHIFREKCMGQDAREMAQWVKCILGKYKDLNSDPQCSWRSWVLVILLLGRYRPEDPRNSLTSQPKKQ